MPFRRLAENSAFGPDEIAALVTAFEEALEELGLTDREDPATLMVAERIINAAIKGERDPVRLREAGLNRRVS
jgi:hypothetical protein